MIHLFLVLILIYVHINNVYDYACIEMKNLHNATFSLVLHGTIAKSRNGPSGQGPSNFVHCFVAQTWSNGYCSIKRFLAFFFEHFPQLLHFIAFKV